MEKKLLTSAENNNYKREFKISRVLIDNWTYWIAIEIVTLFQSQKPVNVQVKNLIQILDFDRDLGFNSLLTELNDKQRELENFTSSQYPDLREILELYFYEIISFQITDLTQDLLIELSNLLKNSLDVQFNQASPKNLIVFLRELIKELGYKRGEWEQKKRFYLEREKSAWKSFEKLSEQEDNSMWKAVEIALESKMESEKYGCISFIIVELIQICQSYSIIIKESFKVLEQIKQSLQEKNSLNIALSIPVFSLLEKINVDEQEKLLEIWMGGHKLNHWGHSPASWQSIEDKLISNIEPVVWAIFSEFEVLFMDYL